MIPGNAPLRRYIKGNAFFSEVTTENLNQTVDELDRLRNDERSNREPLRVGDGNVTEVRLGLITDSGPNSETDPSDNSYWILPQRPDPSLNAGDALATVDENLPDLAGIFLATNLGEPSTAHALNTDETLSVILFSVTFDTYPTITHWFFNLAPPQMIPVLLTQTGGAIGTKTTASTWTYTVTDISSNPITTGASPSVARPNGTLGAASFGIGYYPPDGSDFVLLHAFEIIGSGGCP